MVAEGGSDCSSKRRSLARVSFDATNPRGSSFGLEQSSPNDGIHRTHSRRLDHCRGCRACLPGGWLPQRHRLHPLALCRRQLRRSQDCGTAHPREHGLSWRRHWAGRGQPRPPDGRCPVPIEQGPRLGERRCRVAHGSGSGSRRGKRCRIESLLESRSNDVHRDHATGARAAPAAPSASARRKALGRSRQRLRPSDGAPTGRQA